jgi:Flp pilus assembly protein CpaB
MNTKAIIIIVVLAVIGVLAYVFIKRQSTQQVVNTTRSTQNTTGLTSIFNTKAGEALLKSLF